MKILIPCLNYSYILLFYFITCSQSTAQGSSSLCRELNLDRFSTFSTNSSWSTAILGFLHPRNESFSLQLSRNLPTNSCQVSIVRSSSGSYMWNSSIPVCSKLLLLLDQNGSLVLFMKDHAFSVLWRSHAVGIQVRSFELGTDGKLLVEQSKANCKALQQRSMMARLIRQLSYSRKGKLLLESNSIAISENGSVESDVELPSNGSGSSNLTVENSGSPASSGNDQGHRDKKALAMEIVFPVVGFLLLLALCSALFFGRKRKSAKALTTTLYSNDASHMQKSMTRGQEDEALLENLASAGLPPRFSYAEMDEATNGFATKLGEGGYGAVFEGELPPPLGTKIAVKVFLDTASLACRNGFCKEVMSIGEKTHQNLVQLRGFCVEDEHRMLVYELMENGSLNRVLFGSKASEKSKLSWERRKAIATDTARALAFLHEEGEQKRAVIHCDVKPENILLNENWVAKVSDFGLAKLLWGASTMKHHEDDIGDSSDGRRSPSGNFDGSSTWDTGCLSSLISSKGIRGTLGYLAPEWVSVEVGPDAITTASDVYSFGVVILEVIAGRRSMVPGCPFLLGQAFDMLNNGDDLANLLDPHLLEGSPLSENLEDARNFVKVALWCLQENTALRPTMAAIVTMLTGKEMVSSPPFCDYFAGSSHFFDEVDYPLQENLFSSNTFIADNKDQETSSTTSYGQGSWQVSIISGR